MKVRTLALGTLAASALTGCAGEEEGFSLYEPPPAFFQQVRVNVDGGGDGSGTVVASDPAVGINCQITSGQETGANCDSTFPDAGGGGNFSLTAVPAAGHVFIGWSGACAGSGPVCALSFVAGADVQFDVVATFVIEGSDS